MDCEGGCDSDAIHLGTSPSGGFTDGDFGGTIEKTGFGAGFNVNGGRPHFDIIFTQRGDLPGTIKLRQFVQSRAACAADVHSQISFNLRSA